jgi:hypothetical protein
LRPPEAGVELLQHPEHDVILQHAAPTAAIRVAWSAQHRLHARYRRLLARGKSPQLAVTAVARELSAFVWAALTQ